MTRWIAGALLATGLLLTSHTHAQLTPEKAAQSYKVSEGLEFRLWASEPLFVNPTCMDIDHRGRVWVCESVNYRNKLRRLPKFNRPAGDRIVILEDTKGTGIADRATTFYQSPGLLAPLGIAVAKDPVGPGYKVFVCQSPDILVFEDADGDGKADGPPRKLLTGFGGFDHDHGVHGILIGPDMKLYFSVGDTGVHGLQSSDKKGRVWRSNSTDCRAGTIWRCNLDGTNLELLAHNFRNEYEPCVDSFGNVFVSDNDDDGNQQTRICFVMPGGNYGYHPRGKGETHWHEEQPGVVPKILRTYFGSPTGICMYEGKLLPAKYRSQVLHTDAGPRHVRCYHLKPEGASFAVDREDMVESKDNWFRPADVCVAPDGSVFVADWYDPGVGGHGMGDTTRGRIYRITPKGHVGYKVPNVDLSTGKGVLAALGSPALSVRYMAMAHLAGMKREDAIALLTPAAKQKDNPVLRARVLWQLARAVGTSGVATEALMSLREDPDPRFQVLAIRLATDFLGWRNSNLPAFSMMLGKNASPAVCRECLLRLRDHDADKAKPALYELMKAYDGKDRFYLAAIGIAVGQDPARRETILADFDKHFMEWDDRVAGLIWELRPPRLLGLLEKRVTDASIPAAQRAKIVDILAGSTDAGAGTAMLKLLGDDSPPEVRERAAENLKLHLHAKWQSLRKSSTFEDAVRSLLRKPDTRITALDLIAAAGFNGRTSSVLDIARGKEEPAAVRKAAILTLGQLPSDDAVSGLGTLLAEVPADLQPEVAKALGEIGKRQAKEPGARKAVQVLQNLVKGAKTPAALRDAAIIALTAGRDGSRWLLDLHEKGEMSADVAGTAGRILRNSPYRDLQNKALVAFPPPGKLNPKKLPPIPVLAGRKGDASKGKQILAASTKNNAACMKCHMIRGQGGQVGPDLSMIGKKASRENLFESILYPSKAIADQYVTWTVETNKGLSISGLLIEETPAHVILRDAEGRDTKVSKKTIEKREKSPKSLMPEDLVVQLSEDELVDLVEYLLTLKTASLSISGWHIAGPFDNGSGMEGLDRVFPPERKIDLAASYEGKAGKVTWRTVKANATGYIDLQAFFAGGSAQIVSYLVADVESPAEQEATLLIGTDDGAKLWLDGKEVFVSRETRSAAPEQNTVKLKLKKGSNRFLLKINNGDGPHGFYFTLLSEQELKPAGK